MKLISIPKPIPLKQDEQSLLNFMSDQDESITRKHIENQSFSVALPSLIEKDLIQIINEGVYCLTKKGESERARLQYHKPFMDRNLESLAEFLHGLAKSKLGLGFSVYPFYFVTAEGFLSTVSREEVTAFFEELEEEARMYAYSLVNTANRRFPDDDFRSNTVLTMATIGGSERVYRVEDQYEVTDGEIIFTRLTEGYESKLSFLQERNRRVNGSLEYSV